MCLSLLLHGSISYVMLGVLQRQTARQLRLPPPPLPQQRFAATADPLVVPDAAIPPTLPPGKTPLPHLMPRSPAKPPLALALLPPPPPPPPLAPALPAAPKPLAKLPDIEDLPQVDSEFGSHDGKGTAMHSSAGDQPMAARKGPQDQAWISRDEIGAGDRNNLPSQDSGKLGAPGPITPEIIKPDAPEPIATLTSAPQPQQPAFGVTPPQQQFPKPPAPRARADRASALGPGPLDRPANETATATTRPAPRPAPSPNPLLTLANPPTPPAIAPEAPARSSTRPSAQEPLAKTGPAGDNGTGKPGHTASDPAPVSDSESDAFSTTGAAVFRNGKLEARFGRKVKTVRPRLNLAGQYDLLSLPSPSVIMKVRTDQTGRVRNVEILKSSGSGEVDQPCQLAMYEWWFEPPTDKSGKPQPAEMTWTIAWRR